MMWSEGKERWIKYYSSSHSILLVGEGDFSFALCLAMTFGCATNIIATSLDSYDELVQKYKYANANLVTLRTLGASVLHRVDATKMITLPELQCKEFHRIIYNFPHAGFYGKEDNPDMMMMHKELVRGFLYNASSMLHVDGEVHVNHKTTAPFDSWKIEDLGSEFSLVCTAQDEFRIADYPCYNNKRGSGSRADEPFPLGACKTYMFKLSPFALNNLILRKLHFLQQQTRLVYGNGAALQNYGTECLMIFRRYLKHVEETFGDTSYDLCASIEEAVRVGYEMYLSNGRHSGDLISILKKLHNLSIVRSERLRHNLSIVRAERLRQLLRYS